MSLPAKMVQLHTALAAAELPHAFGGALALAWCTGRARGTIDIDLNIFVDVESARAAVDALPTTITRDDDKMQILVRDGQVRLWWEHTPVDLFLNTTDFHQEAAARVRWESFMGERLPFLSCDDLAVFKAFFNRARDWVDLEEMAEAGTLGLTRVSGVIAQYLGGDDERLDKLRVLGHKPSSL